MTTAILRIHRGPLREAGRYDEFEVPFAEGASVLDGLIWVRAHRDAGLAIRYSCLNANVCKECVVQVDGRTEYACTARLAPRRMTIDPAPGKRLLRDLATDLVPAKERP